MLRFLLFLFILAMPFDKYKIFSLSASNIFLIFLVIFSFFDFFMKKRKIIKSNLYPFIYLFFISSMFSIFGAYDPYTSLRTMITLAGMITVVVVIINIVNSEKYLFFAVKTILFSSMLVSVMALIQFVAYKKYNQLFWGVGGLTSTGYKFDVFRAAGIIKDPNYLAFFLLPTIIIATYIFFSEPFSKRLKSYVGLVLLLNLITSILTFSRSFLLLLIIFIVYFLIDKRKEKFLLSLFPVFIIVGYLYGSKFVNFIVSFNPGSIQMRWENISFGLRIFYQNFFVGTGLGNLKFLPENPHFAAAHNTYVQIGADTGILGLISFFLMLIAVFYGTRKRNMMYRFNSSTRILNKALVTSFIFVLLGGLFLDVLMLKTLWLYLGLVAFGYPSHFSKIKNKDFNINSSK